MPGPYITTGPTGGSQNASGKGPLEPRAYVCDVTLKGVLKLGGSVYIFVSKTASLLQLLILLLCDRTAVWTDCVHVWIYTTKVYYR